jgi:glycosyltransferase involved in cell wall biosynthesis
VKPLNIFYKEPDRDRWFPFDRYPRKAIRRVVRGKTAPGGVMMIALELMKGLDRLGVPYRFNNFGYISRHPDELACIIGKPQLLDGRSWKNPVIFGAGVFSHPSDYPDLLVKHPNIRKILVPGPWMKDLFAPFYGPANVASWPAGIDTERWSPAIKKPFPAIDFLIYDKVRWERPKFEKALITPLRAILERHGFSMDYIRYGSYTPPELLRKLSNVRAALFLCEHETQGLACQQMLSTGTPLLAWDRGGYWQDPDYFPRVKVGPVSSVPYWDERCGIKFTGIEAFESCLLQFMERLLTEKFSPRSYVMENLSLEVSAKKYLSIFEEVEKNLL